MKRYRILSFDLDTRASLLNLSMEGWSKETKENFQKQISQVKARIFKEYGIINGDKKILRFKEMGAKPVSIIAHHNLLLNQIRASYVQGAFYPALTSTCTLGERILNHLIIDLRDEFKEELESKEITKHPCENFETLREKGLVKTKFDIFSCKSCSNWNLMISNLVKWGVLNSIVEGLFKKLVKKRHKSIHFNENTISNLKNDSLEAIKLLQEIVQNLFPAIGSKYFIPTKGEAFLKKELESKPFFKKYYIPNSKRVSPYHKVKSIIPKFVIEDIKIKDNKEITDDEFIKLREEFQKKRTPPKQ